MDHNADLTRCTRPRRWYIALAYLLNDTLHRMRDRLYTWAAVRDH